MDAAVGALVTDACSTTILAKTTSTQVVRPSAGPSYVSAANSQSALMAAVQKQPVAVSFYAAFNAFYYYTGGVINPSGCPTPSDHAVLLVGERALPGQWQHRIGVICGITCVMYSRVTRGITLV